MIPYIMWICKCLCFEKLGYTSQMLQAFISGTFWIDCLITCKLPLDGTYRTNLSVEFLMDVGINAEPMLALLQKNGVNSSLSYDNDLMHQRILFAGDDLQVGKEIWEKIAYMGISQIEDLTGGHIVWEDGANGVVQLMLLAVIGEIMKRD